MPKSTRGGRRGGSGGGNGTSVPNPTTSQQQQNQQQNQQQQNQNQNQNQNNSQDVNDLIKKMREQNKDADLTVRQSYRGSLPANGISPANHNRVGGQVDMDFHIGEGSSKLDFTNNGNADMIKYQTVDDDKAQRYLARVGKQQTPAMDAEGYAYHQSQFQNLIIAQNLNAPVYARLNSNDFDTYCRGANLTPIYRGWDGGQKSKDRFEDAKASHVGCGMYGEGFYFGDNYTGSTYGNVVTKAALSPNARVVDLATVRSAIAKSSSGLQAALNRSGNVPGSHFDPNAGEAQMALRMGANVIRTSWSYIILSRDAVVICDT